MQFLGFRMAGVTLTDSGVVFHRCSSRPKRPSVVVQHIAGEEGRPIRRALGAQTADCAGLVVDRLLGTGCSRLQILRPCFFSREAVCRHLVFAATTVQTALAAGRHAAVAPVSAWLVSRLQIRVGLFIAVLASKRPSRGPAHCRRRRSPHPPCPRSSDRRLCRTCSRPPFPCRWRRISGTLHPRSRRGRGQPPYSALHTSQTAFCAGRFAAGVLRVAFLFPALSVTSQFLIGIFMPVMRCIGRPIGLPAMARSWNRLYFCCVALGAAICLFARFCAGRRCCYRTVVPSMRAYVILFIATGTLLPVLVIIMCPTGSKIMSQSIAIFRTANCACCSWQVAVPPAILGFRMAVSRLQIRVVFSSLFCVQAP